jgi:hypothetical protein
MTWEKGRWLIHCSLYDWKFTKVNWIEFTFVCFRVEADYFCRTYELHLGLLGVNLNVAYCYGTL